jgi:hypothetical protein
MGRPPVTTNLLIPRESVELIPFVGLKHPTTGLPIRDGVECSIQRGSTGDRPGPWEPATVIGDAVGYLTGTLAPGRYWVWVRLTAATETPVSRLGYFTIT